MFNQAADFFIAMALYAIAAWTIRNGVYGDDPAFYEVESDIAKPLNVNFAWM
jgi:hypothetical protein